MTQRVHVIGAGPAGSAAAIAALSEGCEVRLFDKSRFPRHKVCGEFLSSEVAGILQHLGAWDDFDRLKPSRIRRFSLHLGNLTKHAVLPECAYGLSRYELDRLLFDRALASGAVFVRQATVAAEVDLTFVLATGRKSFAPGRDRLFGFKAHFRGPVDDGVELFFFRGGYVGVSCVEQSITNVCGIAPESMLRSHGFDPDGLLRCSPALADRVRPLSRSMPWLTVGPLVFSSIGAVETGPNVYPAGDALGFADPFTGTGVVNAVLTGRLAGIAAATGSSRERYLRDCRRALSRLFRLSALLRQGISAGWAEFLMPLVPGSWVFRCTRPAAG